MRTERESERESLPWLAGELAGLVFVRWGEGKESHFTLS